MSYKETLDFMYSQLPMYQRVGNIAYKKDLKNTLDLCEFLGNPQSKFKSIHVAGTNGKGSVSHMIASVLQQYGYKVGLYTSPHYKDFRERIKINAKLISRKYVMSFIDGVQPIIEQIRPSFFEITVAMAFDYFASQEVDFAVIETGLGGRLDSTNVIDPVLSVITNISFDHIEILGDTLEKIAFEKAGIIKPNKPVIIGEKNIETAQVFKSKASECKSLLTFAEDEILISSDTSEFAVETYAYSSKNGISSTVSMNFPGPYQNENIRTSLATLSLLADLGYFKWHNEKVDHGFRNIKEATYFLGRWEKLSFNPTIIADSAHNQAGLMKVFEKLETMEFEKLHLVLGFVNDKKLDKVFELLPTSAKYYFAKANIPRGLPSKELKKEALKYGLQGKAYVSVRNAFAAAKRAAKEKDLIYIGGSIFVVAEIL